MAKPSVVVEGISKKFGISLKSALKFGIIDTCRRIVGKGKNETLRTGEFWALEDVNFSLEPGDALGIMGVNGSGKTTLLRILNGTYSPDKGKAIIRGRLGALIAAGAGFSPMLTGRENVFISGSLLGMTPKEIRSRFDEIVDFADLAEFIDMPVRNYSSGMSVRLGFAVAVLGSPDVLLVDEVLAVGDMSFQKKCYERIFALRKEGTTILFVSHSVGAVWVVCNKGIYLHHGKTVEYGNVEDVVRCYDEHNFRASNKAITAKEIKEGTVTLAKESGKNRGGTGDAFCTGVRILSPQEEEIAEIPFQSDVILEFAYTIVNTIQKPLFRASIDSVHYKFIASLDSLEQGCNLDVVEPGDYIFRFKIKELSLRPGAYTINMSIASQMIGVHIFYWLAAAQFTVLHPHNIFLYSNPQAVLFLNATTEFAHA